MEQLDLGRVQTPTRLGQIRAIEQSTVVHGRGRPRGKFAPWLLFSSQVAPSSSRLQQ